MSINLKLNILNKEYSLLEFNYSFSQNTDSFGRPCSDIQCGFIHLLVDATFNTALVEKISDSSNPLKGKIFYYDIISDRKIKEIEFSNGYIIFYEEIFNAEGSILCKEKLIISAQNVQVGKVKFQNNWPS
jgi:hypothetical protein